MSTESRTEATTYKGVCRDPRWWKLCSWEPPQRQIPHHPCANSDTQSVLQGSLWIGKECTTHTETASFPSWPCSVPEDEGWILIKGQSSWLPAGSWKGSTKGGEQELSEVRAHLFLGSSLQESPVHSWHTADSQGSLLPGAITSCLHLWGLLSNCPRVLPHRHLLLLVYQSSDHQAWIPTTFYSLICFMEVTKHGNYSLGIPSYATFCNEIHPRGELPFQVHQSTWWTPTVCTHLMSSLQLVNLGCFYFGAAIYSTAMDVLLISWVHKHTISLAKYQGVARAMASVHLNFGT